MKTLADIFYFLNSLKNPHPSRDWLIALSTAALVLAVFLGIAIFLFLGIRSGIVVGSAEGKIPASPTVTRGELKVVVEAYQKKELNFGAKNYPTPKLSDPAP